MEPLANKFTKNLSGCSGCGTNLSNPEFDYLWQPKGGNDGTIHCESDQASSSGSGQSGGSVQESAER